MSDIDRYTSQAILREENLYYDMGYRFANSSGKKPIKAFSKDYTMGLFVVSLIIQVLLGISQFYSIISLIILFIIRYMNPERSKSPIYMILLVSAHVYDYYRQDILALPGKFFQGRLTSLFWIVELIWVILLSYQFLIIFQPYTPLLAEKQSVKPETKEAKEQFEKMRERMNGTDYSIQPLNRLINIERLQKTLITLIKIVSVIVSIGIFIDIVIWRIIYNFGGGDNIIEEYIITGMSLILFIMLVGFSHLIVEEPKKDEIE